MEQSNNMEQSSEMEKIAILEPFLSKIADEKQKERMLKVLEFVISNYPELTPKIAWNQPMFTDHETFIIAFSVSKKHIAIAPEKAGILHFSEEIVEAGYEHTSELIRVPWNNDFNFTLLKRIVEYNIVDKKDCSTFWRK